MELQSSEMTVTKGVDTQTFYEESKGYIQPNEDTQTLYEESKEYIQPSDMSNDDNYYDKCTCDEVGWDYKCESCIIRRERFVADDCTCEDFGGGWEIECNACKYGKERI